MNFSSNTNEVIRAVLNPLKAQKAQKSIKSIKSTKTQPSKRTKAQISEQKQRIRLKISKGKIVTYSLICIFVRVKKRKLEKREKFHNGNVLNTDVPTTRLMYYTILNINH